MKRLFPKIKRHHIHRVSDAGDFVLTAIAVMLALAMVASGYAGMADPHVMPSAAVVAMMFPLVTVLSLAVAVVLLLMRRRLLWVSLVSFVVSLPALLVYSPLNLGRMPDAGELPRSFSLMTYNALSWTDYTHSNLDTVTPNRSIMAVLDADPDMVCLQECGGVSRYTPGVTHELLDTFFRRYPYVERGGGHMLTLYSKFPVTRLVGREEMSNSADYACYRINVRGRLLTLYNVHLQSIGLSKEDKALYREITNGNTGAGEIKRVRHNIFSKLYAAFVERADQVALLRSLVDTRGGNVIVCGDFNDIPGSYAVRTVMGADMHDAFADAGAGPSITYRAGRFFFRIDHTLYRGDFRPVKSARIRAGLSDHYPVMTTFVWNEPSVVETRKADTDNK